MLHPTHQELISAYFDGENTAAERAEAERLLAEDPQARAWWEELRQVRGEVQSLPCFKLEEHFAEHVLRRAERAMLLEAAGPNWDSGSPAYAWADAPASRNGRLRNVEPSSDRVVQPSVAQPTARTTSVRWYGPAWLAAAASLVLFAGLFFRPGADSWRVTHAERDATPSVKAVSALPTKPVVDGGMVAPAPAPESFLEDETRGIQPTGNKEIEGKDIQDKAGGEDVYYFALGTAESANGQVVVVCDVNGQPRNTVADFEKLLSKRQKIDRQLGLAYADVSSEGEKEAAAVEGNQQSDESTTRVYYVSMAPQQLAATLREVSALGDSEISISGFSAPNRAPPQRAATTLAMRPAPSNQALTPTPTIFVLRLNNARRPAARTPSSEER